VTSSLGKAPDIIESDDVAWIELGPGSFMKPVRFSKNGEFTFLAKMTAGTFNPRHRHVGDIMAYVISGGGADVNGYSPSEGSWFYERDGAVHDSFVCKEDTVAISMGRGGGLELLDDHDHLIGTYDIGEFFKNLPGDVLKVVERP
jgi:anti-sigma factor ChrR (cupin superfamily)